MAQVRKRLAPIPEKNGVHLMFGGHEHAYERTHPRRGERFGDRGTTYVTTGGAGSHPQPVETTPDVPVAIATSHCLLWRKAGW